MLGRIEEITEYHKNGALFVKRIIAFIDPLFEMIYMSNPNYRTKDINGNDCQPYLKLEYSKWFDNGQFAWSLKWDDKGNLLNKEEPTYRKDGTIIQY